MSAPNSSGDAGRRSRALDSDDFEDFRSGGATWRARAGLREEIETLLQGLGGSPDFEGMPGCETIKATPKRVVWRLPLGGRTVYIKRYRVVGGRERAKYLFARPRARAEWQAAVRLREAGISVLEPLAIGISRSGPFLGDSWFIASELPGERFDRAIENAREAKRDLDPLLRAVVALHEQLLASGFVHPDLHGGNLLVRWEAGQPRIGLVDLHSIRRPGRPPSRSTIERVRAKLAHSLWLVFEEREFERALEMLAPNDVARVRRSLLNIESIRLRSRSKRCIRNSTSFVRDCCGGWILWRRRSVDLDSLLLMVQADAPPDPPSASLPLRIDGQIQPVEVRRFGPLEWTSMRAWKGAHALAVRGIPGPTALAHMRRLRLGVPWDSVLVTEYLPDAHRLDQIDPSDRSEDLMGAALEAAKLNHRFGLSVRPEDLFALRGPDKWRVLRGELEVAPPDRPLEGERAELELEAIRTITAPLPNP